MMLGNDALGKDIPRRVEKNNAPIATQRQRWPQKWQQQRRQRAAASSSQQPPSSAVKLGLVPGQTHVRWHGDYHQAD
jgi:hypothetical protein